MQHTPLYQLVAWACDWQSGMIILASTRRLVEIITLSIPVMLLIGRMVDRLIDWLIV